MLGTSPSKQIGRRPRDFMPPELADRVEPLYQDVLEHATVREGDFTLHEGTSDERRAHATLFPVRRDGDIRGVGAVIIDVTDRARLEEQLRQAQKMEAVGQLAGSVAHDFNNLLTIIIGYSQMIASAADAKPSIQADIAQVRAAADRASALTRQLLVFSRKQLVRPTALDINAVLTDSMMMLRRLIPSDIRVDTKLDPRVDAVWIDRGHLEQVIMNLVVNACDAMPTGGMIHIETANTLMDDECVERLPDARPGCHVMLAVRDAGVGMDAATRERAFEPFFTTKSAGRGTGLGLATVMNIVKSAGGSVAIESTPGGGTTVTVFLPRHSGEPASSTADDESAIATPPQNFLLVDDYPAVREAARFVLEHLGHRVVDAPDAAAALELLSAEPERFDVVLTDSVMPGMSGLDLVAHLAKMRPELPVILMSGYAEDKAGRGRMLPQSVVFLQKPFTVADLASAVARALERTRARM